MSYQITALADNSKDRIRQPQVCQLGIIPKLCSNVLVVGGVGSGKTTLVQSLFCRPEFYKGQFDRIILVSPSAFTDDLQKEIDVCEDDRWDNLNEVPGKLKALLEEQAAAIEQAGGNDKAPIVAVIFDDCAGSDLLKSQYFSRCVLANRHHNVSVLVCTQQYNAIPKRVRLNISSLFFYSGSQAEDERIAEEFSVPGFTKKGMLNLIRFACGGQYNFLHVNRKLPFEERYRKNLDEIIDLSSVPQQ